MKLNNLILAAAVLIIIGCADDTTQTPPANNGAPGNNANNGGENNASNGGENNQANNGDPVSNNGTTGNNGNNASNNSNNTSNNANNANNTNNASNNGTNNGNNGTNNASNNGTNNSTGGTNNDTGGTNNTNNANNNNPDGCAAGCLDHEQCVDDVCALLPLDRDGFGRGLRFVRDEPMMISGLIPSMPAPPAEEVNAYFDRFNANTVQLWVDGLPNRMDGWAAANHPDFRFIAWTLDDGTSADGGELLGGYPANAPGRLGYQIGDEPREWEEYLALDVGVNAIRGQDPESLVIINFTFQAAELDRMLTHACNESEADVISYDRYTWSRDTHETVALFREAALGCGKPYWRYTFSYDNGDNFTASNLRWDAFLGLVYGYTGHSWFLYQVTATHNLGALFFETTDTWDNKTPLYDVVGQINIEMANLGRAVTQLTSTDVRYVPQVDLGLLSFPPGTRAWEPGAGGDPYISAVQAAEGQFGLDILLGFFEDDRGEQYVMAQSQRHTDGSIPTNSDAPGAIWIDLDLNSAPDNVATTHVTSLDKLTGELTTLPLQDLGGGRSRLIVTLAAGDPVLFKYDTGAPFELQAP